MKETLIEISIGARPWSPSENAELAVEFDRYDFPTSGLLKQGEQYFVFECFEGHVMRGNVWVYAHVTSDEATHLCSLAGADLLTAIERTFNDRSVMGVLAIDGRVRSGTVVCRSDIKAKGIGQALLEELQNGRDVATDTAKALHQQLAHA